MISFLALNPEEWAVCLSVVQIVFEWGKYIFLCLFLKKGVKSWNCKQQIAPSYIYIKLPRFPVSLLSTLPHCFLSSTPSHLPTTWHFKVNNTGFRVRLCGFQSKLYLPLPLSVAWTFCISPPSCLLTWAVKWWREQLLLLDCLEVWISLVFC